MVESSLPACLRPPPLFSHLDPPETPVEPETIGPPREDLDTDLGLRHNFRHSGWTHDRQLVYAALCDLNVSYARREAFRTCGSSFWVQQHRTDPERFRLVADHCHDRLCIPCAGTRQAVIRRNALRLIPDRPHRFLTLTIRNVGQDLATMLNRLYTSFRKLRQRSIWKTRVFGGVAFCEVTYNAERQTWNPHLHCILDGYYIDRPDLSRAWLAVTGDSFNVNIRLIRTKYAVVNYVTKYATKPLPHSVIVGGASLPEAIEAFKRRRLVLTFGTWRNWKLLETTDDSDWKLYDHLEAVQAAARSGNRVALNILAMKHTADPHTGEFHVIDDGPAIDDSS